MIFPCGVLAPWHAGRPCGSARFFLPEEDRISRWMADCENSHNAVFKVSVHIFFGDIIVNAAIGQIEGDHCRKDTHNASSQMRIVTV